MFTRTRLLTLAAALAVLAITAGRGPALAQNLGGPHQPTLTTTGQADLNLRQMGECHLYRRAISRRACQDRRWEKVPSDTAEN
jgi:hypothetical protein